MFNGLKPEVRQRLEAAVGEIFSNSDFHKANIRDVARQAGVSFSTIYTHYGSKERLLFAFVAASGLGTASYLTAAAAAVLLACEHCLVRPDDLSRVNTAFFTVNGVISLLLMAVVMV